MGNKRRKTTRLNVLPDWLKPFSAKDEHLRRLHGLTPKRDGWYSSVDGKVRYICSPRLLSDAVAIKSEKLVAIRCNSGGQARPVHREQLTIETLAEHYTVQLFRRVSEGFPRKLTRRSYEDKVKVINRFLNIVGPARPADSLGPSDFTKFLESLKGKAITTTAREMIIIDAWLRWAGPGRHGENLIELPNVGSSWRKPSAEDLASSSVNDAHPPAAIITAFRAVRTSPALRLAGHLAFNCAMLPVEIAHLELDHIDLDRRIIAVRRGKTGMDRVAYLMPSTVRAIKRYMQVRPAATDDEAEPLLMRTPKGRCYDPTRNNRGRGMAVSNQQNKLARSFSRRAGVSLKGMRSAVATIMDDWKDQRALDLLMGHRSGVAAGSIRSKHYAKTVNDERAESICSELWRRAFGHTGRSCAARAEAKALFAKLLADRKDLNEAGRVYSRRSRARHSDDEREMPPLPA